MKLLLSHPEFAPALVCALNETDCLAARTGLNTVEVFAPWLANGGDTAQAAWASRRHPDFRATLLPGT